ncbi:FAD-binding domain-containing protein [Mytilinidion resinicola]|uniref:FAD-binding domain-containing protein n=1 Tax=Mytilinidion resinicola TaxID=574789 RepID=A0A6A6Y411_9PEZI|nr:FAD-binding domain-containing protein [Mytilinidion resinicola]KAF2803576.1 FAD-binding domain-containing protein [Mytilinidion resinicola]
MSENNAETGQYSSNFTARRSRLTPIRSSTCWLPATCFLKLTTTLEVAVALRFVKKFNSSFSIRSGGHNSNPSFGSIGEAGIVLDLGALNTISILPAENVVSVGPGATWDKVYEELEKHKMTVVGGRVSGVGVGGLIIRGGMSHFSNHWGLVCDNVKNFEVVLADSTIVNANATENIDLFRALKGGGSNFGIVTQFDLHTYPDYRVWYTFRVYSAEHTDRVMEAYVKVQEAMEIDDRIGFFLSINAGFLVAGMLYRGSTRPGSAFRAFDGISIMSTPVPERYGTQLSVARAAAMEREAKSVRETATSNVKADTKLYADLHRILRETANTIPPSISLSFTFQPVGLSTAKKGQEHGGNCMNIPPESQSWLAILCQWTDDVDDGLARKKLRELVGGIESLAKVRGKLLDFQFMNDASYTQSPLQSYGVESLESLRAVSRKWDPEGVFQKLQSSGFLLSRAGSD